MPLNSVLFSLQIDHKQQSESWHVIYQYGEIIIMLVISFLSALYLIICST